MVDKLFAELSTGDCPPRGALRRAVPLLLTQLATTLPAQRTPGAAVIFGHGNIRLIIV